MIEGPSRCIAPPEFLCEPGLRRLFAILPEARVVGGAVRDTLAGRPVADVDLATPRDPAAVTAALRAAAIRVVPTGVAHGTVTAVIDGRAVEITTLRRDVATDGRHAVVAFTDDWRADAARRDFTINAMSMRADGAVFDYFGGVRDLAAGVVRFVGDPARRIAEDYLRILRFFRFFARYGRAAPDADTRAALQAGLPGLARLSAERVWNELRQILSAPDPAAAVALMAELGVLAAIIPEGADPDALSRLLNAGAPPDPLLRLAALLTGDASSLADRLRFSAAERKRLETLRAAPALRPDAADDALRRALADHERAALLDRTWLDGSADPAWSRLRARLGAMETPVFPLRGEDMVRLGLAPGPAIGVVLRSVRAWWLAGGCRADGPACRDEARRRLSADGGKR
jgi:poly(A) polymerase